MRNALIETLDTATAIKRNTPGMISLPQKLVSPLGEGTIISSCRSSQLALLNKPLLTAAVLQSGSVQITRSMWFPTRDTILQHPGQCPRGHRDGSCATGSTNTFMPLHQLLWPHFLHRRQEFECAAVGPGDYGLLAWLEDREELTAVVKLLWQPCCLTGLQPQLLIQPLQADSFLVLHCGE